MPWLINATQLDKFRKSQKNLVILDASFHLDDTRNAKQEFIDKHIVDAQFFDIAEFCDPTSAIPNMLIQDEDVISEKLSNLGIRNDFKIIIYDNSELHSSARALWMFKMFGHNPHQLYILDGGFKAYESAGFKTESGIKNVGSKVYKAEWKPQFLRTLTDVKNNLKNPTQQIVDLRHPVRYAGGKETRAGLRAGHIPGSVCLPYFILFEKDGTFLSQDKIRKKLNDLNIDPALPTLITCGSAITAPILDFLLDIMNFDAHGVYDGSWSEYGSENLFPGENSLMERPIETCVDN